MKSITVMLCMLSVVGCGTAPGFLPTPADGSGDSGNMEPSWNIPDAIAADDVQQAITDDASTVQDGSVATVDGSVLVNVCAHRRPDSGVCRRSDDDKDKDKDKDKVKDKDKDHEHGGCDLKKQDGDDKKHNDRDDRKHSDDDRGDDDQKCPAVDGKCGPTGSTICAPDNYYYFCDAAGRWILVPCVAGVVCN